MVVFCGTDRDQRRLHEPTGGDIPWGLSLFFPPTCLPKLWRRQEARRRRVATVPVTGPDIPSRTPVLLIKIIRL
jgi:hypothetical protein